jgi:hypothetical protein
LEHLLPIGWKILQIVRQRPTINATPGENIVIGKLISKFDKSWLTKESHNIIQSSDVRINTKIFKFFSNQEDHLNN